MKNELMAKWRIDHMELWDREAIDLLGPAFIEIREGGQGSFRFIAVEGHIDYRFEEYDEAPIVRFSWEGTDECDMASGRGWFRPVENGVIEGRIYLHNGDDSAFTASR